MSVDLKTQIRSYAEQVERRQRSLSVDDVVAPVGYQDVAPVAHRSRSYVPPWALTRGPWAAVVAAVVVIVLFGGLALLLPRTDQTTIDDVIAPLDEGEAGHFFPSTTPDGFTLWDIETGFGQTAAIYLPDISGVWTPNDGGLVVSNPRTLPIEDPEGYLSEVLAATPGASPVEVAGHPGVVHEVQIEQGPVLVSRVTVLGVDSFGHVFEVAGVGMSPEDVLDVADGLVRVPFEHLVERRTHVVWDVRAGVRHDDFVYDLPQVVEDPSIGADLVLGVDLLRARLYSVSGDGSTTDWWLQDSTLGLLYLSVPGGAEDAVVADLHDEVPLVELSPRLSRDRLEAFIDHVRDGGTVLSRDPFVLQASEAPAPRFDVSTLGDEVPLAPAASADALAPRVFEGFLHQGDDRPLATEETPFIVIGVSGGESDDVPVYLYSTVSGIVCIGGFGGETCEYVPFAFQGIRGVATTTTDSSAVVTGMVAYSVPLETSVVQFVTLGSANHWQRPIGGHGAISYGDTINRPSEIIALDADGNEIGRWDVRG